MRNKSSGFFLRIIIAVGIVIFSFIKFYSSSDVNEITGEKQYLSLSKEEEIALGLNSASQMASEFGGLSQNAQARYLVDSIGNSIVKHSVARSEERRVGRGTTARCRRYSTRR